MTEDRVREALRSAPVPDERGAEERAWRVIRAAYAEGRHARPPRIAQQRFGRIAIVVAMLAVLVSPAGANVRHWVADAIDTGHEPSRPALTSLPASGNLLVDSAAGPWVVHPDGSKRLLGDYQQATWSPRGLFVAVTTRHQLLAVDPEGNVRWSLARSGAVRDPSWSPDGYRIAYLSGDTLRVVAGDGTGDRLLERRVRPITPAWRAGARHVLAFVAADGSVRTVEADTGRPLFRTEPGLQPTQLVWSSRGSRLLLSQRSGVRVLNGEGRLIWRDPAPAGTRVRAMAPSPTSPEVAMVVTRQARTPRSQVLLVGPGGSRHQLFAGPGRFKDIAWSPNGKWLLIGWPSANQWLFIRLVRPQRIVAVSHIASQFAPGTTVISRFPGTAGWCCQAR